MRFVHVVAILGLSTGHAWAQPGDGAPAQPPETSAKPPPALGAIPPRTAGDHPPPTVGDHPPPTVGDKPAEPLDSASKSDLGGALARNLPAASSNGGHDATFEAIVVPLVLRDEGFRFGSYGRVTAGTDLRGGKPERILVVAHGPRIVEPSYLELEFSYGFEIHKGFEGVNSYLAMRPVITLAFDDTLFHDTGNFDAHPAIRNMFLDARLSRTLSMWVGSRMYRGDDIYLFDYWPLDDQNTVGAGLLYRALLFPQHEQGDEAHMLELSGHVGWNRLNQPFQFQQIDVANPVQGATTVVQLNRQRMVASATASYIQQGPPNDVSFKVKLHGEVHELPSGTRKRDDGTFEALPADSGFLIGGEVSLFNLGGDQVDHRFRRHLNLFTRYAKGLAAFDELAPPTTFGADLKTQHASELTFGASGNWDSKLGNMMLGALSRRFIDATGNAISPNNGWEYALDVRPLAKVARDWFLGADLSYQARFPNGLNPITLRAEDASVFELAPMAVFSPMGPSAYDRPQLRFVYRAAHLNDGALDLYVPDDPRHAHAWVHFIGVQAEWWFNSSTYK